MHKYLFYVQMYYIFAPVFKSKKKKRNMKRRVLFSILVLAMTVTSAFAGGLLTNTNQNVAFLRNPARGGTIGIDGVYSNPAGVAFLNKGFHLSLNSQSAWQTRTATTTNPLFQMGVENNGATTKQYKGTATAPVIPSIQAAYNMGKWSFQFGFAVSGGGGKCEFANGLGSFEGAVAQIAAGLQPFGAQGYDAGYFMEGKQYYFGVTLGAAYKLNEHLSVYGGLRALIGSASYKAKISDIMVKTANGTVPFSGFLDATNAYITSTLNDINANLPLINAGIEQLKPIVGNPNAPAELVQKYETLTAQKAQLEAAKTQLEGAQPLVEELGVYREGVNLQSDQSGFGIAPVLGIDYKIGQFNFGAKYEFRTKMMMKNKSTLKEAMAIEAVNQFRDGTEVPEDAPAMLTIGAEWSALKNLRLDAGFVYYFDKQAKKYGDKQNLLSSGSKEFLAGIEYDPIKKLTVSGGIQVTRLGLSDEYMSDLSFNVSSWSFGLGLKYQISKRVAVNAAYFHTTYGDYNTTATAEGVKNSFTRSSKVAGIGLDFTF